jgi:(Z)-2-((N-methylformamido)methylene)-5-hydroxybutyrolactone dehydrogenase
MSTVAVEKYQMNIDGRFRLSSDGTTFGSVNPFTGEVWAEVPKATAR